MGSEGPSVITIHVTGVKKFHGVAENPTETIVSNLKDFMQRGGLPEGLVLGSCSILEAAGQGAISLLYQVFQSSVTEPNAEPSSVGRVIWDKSEPFIRPGRMRGYAVGLFHKQVTGVNITYLQGQQTPSRPLEREVEEMVATEGSGGGNSSIEGIGIPDVARRLRESSEKGRVLSPIRRVVSGPPSRRRNTTESFALRVAEAQTTPDRMSDLGNLSMSWEDLLSEVTSLKELKCLKYISGTGLKNDVALSLASADVQKEPVAPTSLRIALSKLYPDSNFFQQAQMNDASEVLEVIFDCIHQSYASGSDNANSISEVLGWQNSCESADDISATLATLTTEVNIAMLYDALHPGNRHKLVSVGDAAKHHLSVSSCSYIHTYPPTWHSC
ncbi:hypothetical protein QJS10_CPA09g00223 [Acorus calamus]|uniref:Uncharacterized protein n=1 Tax=Acorus calamus TaxID=4465 RepID=A0AAV9E527_ACOCL|nr:hypothetical protein QJS10_CPA09g00223 [Acorus calamus]